MELDDLKESWQRQDQQLTNTNIMELIHQKSYGPIAALKQSFKKQMRFMIVIPVLLFLVYIKDWQATLGSVLFWSYVVFCLGVVLYNYGHYRVVRTMEGMQGPVKAMLQQQIDLLEARLRRNMLGVRIALLYFVVLLEVLPFFQHYRMLDKWHALSPLIRISAYAGLFLLQYFVSRSVKQRKFGQHITYLKNLVSQMQ